MKITISNQEQILALQCSVFVCLDIICKHTDPLTNLSLNLKSEILSDIINLQYAEVLEKYKLSMDAQTESLFIERHLQSKALPQECVALAQVYLQALYNCNAQFFEQLSVLLETVEPLVKSAMTNLLNDVIIAIAGEQQFELDSNTPCYEKTKPQKCNTAKTYGYGGYGYGGYGYGGYGYGGYGYGGYGYGGYGYGYNGEGYGSGYDSDGYQNVKPDPLTIDCADENVLKLHQYLWRGMTDINGNEVRLKPNEYLSADQVKAIIFRIPKCSGALDEQTFRAIAHVAADPDVYKKLIISHKK